MQKQTNKLQSHLATLGFALLNNLQALQMLSFKHQVKKVYKVYRLGFDNICNCNNICNCIERI